MTSSNSSPDLTRTDAPAEAMAEPLILTSREGAIFRVTLNRPRAINALNSEMFRGLRAALREAEAASEAGEAPIAIVLDSAGERGFCGGGDIKELASGGVARAIFQLEYELNYAISVSPIPVVAYMDGVTMGGGIGLGGHAAFRIVTETSRLAMPETRIGIAPDVGGHLLLANAPGRLGEYLAITAGEMNARDAIDLGFADTFVPRDRLAPLREALAAGRDPRSIIATHAAHSAVALPPSTLGDVRRWFDPIADAALGERGQRDAIADPVAAAQRLIDALEASPHLEARETAKVVRGMNPVSIALTLAQIARTRAEQLDLAGVLSDDFRIMSRLAELPNFAEGVRAQVIDKDRDPKWMPARIEDLTPDTLAELLKPHCPSEAPLGLYPQG